MYGGPYVLGQNEDDLKLVPGRAHTPLTIQLLRAKNLVYTLTMLMPYSSPFNTAVFVLFYRGPGFGYHRDQCNIEGKNVTMTDEQPVCTTVLYQQKADAGKETVYWIPNGKKYDKSYDNNYLALCNLETRHGTEHVQCSGLQSISKHAVLHTANTRQRTGARVNITSRVSHLDAAERVEALKKAWNPHKKQLYKEELSPSGTIRVRWF